MSILIAQLGDIHFQESTGLALSRAPQIGAAIAAETGVDISSVVLAICGDAAYSGQAKEFLIAQTFMESIETAIRSRAVSVPIIRVLVPGNHDCDFTGDQAARNAILQVVKECEVPAASIQEMILCPLQAYFNFAEEFTDGCHAITRSQPFYKAVEIREGDARLRLHLLNTAWMSSIHEVPGSLHFPLTVIAPPPERADCSVAILHHPTHWFSQPHTMRPLRDRLAELAEVVLVNHEHVPESVLQGELRPHASGTPYMARQACWGSTDVEHA